MRPAESPAASLDSLAGALAGAEAVSADTGQYRILVAEDNLVNQKVARRLVEKLGYAVDVVEDGQRALAAAMSGNYALILMDCQMPVLDGIQGNQGDPTLGRRHWAGPDSGHDRPGDERRPREVASRPGCPITSQAGESGRTESGAGAVVRTAPPGAGPN